MMMMMMMMMMTWIESLVVHQLSAPSLPLSSSLIGTSPGALLLVPVLEVQIVTIVFLCLHRMILFSILLSYTSSTFGFKNFGFILGLLQLIASALSVIVYPIISAVESHLDGNFFWVNLAFLAAMMPLWVICPAKFPKKK